MSRRIDINADLAEGFTSDAGLLAVVTSANIACGAHAGGEAAATAAVVLASELGVCIGAHPGYPDRPGFGRHSLAMTNDALRSTLHQQLDWLLELTHRLDVPTPSYLKLHGALYHDAAQVASVADLTAEVAIAYGLPRLVAPGSNSGGASIGMRGAYYLEGFVDRRYTAAGTLEPRSSEGAVLTDPTQVAHQALSLAEGGPLPLSPLHTPGHLDSLCVHGDTPGAVAMARAVRDWLELAGYEIKNFLD